MSTALHVIQAGPLTTLQDTGRRGYQSVGVPVAGAMDALALAVGNRMLGNQPSTAGIEIALSGLRLRVGGGAVRVAVTGAASLAVNGTEYGAWVAATVRRGQTISVAPLADGQFGYLTVAGGFAVDAVLGSLSTHLRAGIGPFGGRAIAAEDRLPVPSAPPGRSPLTQPAFSLPPALVPRPPARIRAVPGPQDSFFGAATMARFFEADFAISRQSDRMGYRLEGPVIPSEGTQNIISEGIAPGSVQVPGSGQPIVLMADRQSVGGYPKIATVISSDLGWLAQRRPGERVGFEAVTAERSIAIRRDLEDRLAAIRPPDGAA
ncbi:MAG: biotin-dependent carboxyltransferase family protein [Azospirillaceae bacterium]